VNEFAHASKQRCMIHNTALQDST